MVISSLARLAGELAHMVWRAAVVFHIVLGLLELVRTGCSHSNLPSPCSFKHLGSFSASLPVITACYLLSGNPVRSLATQWQLLRRRNEILLSALGYALAAVPVISDMLKNPGNGLELDGNGVIADSMNNDAMPGTWTWRKDKGFQLDEKLEKPSGMTVAVEVFSSSSESSLSDHDDSGFESNTQDSPIKVQKSPNLHCGEYATQIDSSAHPESITLEALDMALFGEHMARTYGAPGAVLFQRVDAFLKPSGKVVHYVELLLEWVPPSLAHNPFVIFTGRPVEHEEVGGTRLVGTRVHAFRARKCDPATSSRAELLLNRLGLGTRWTCNCNWDTPLGRSFDGHRYLHHTLKQVAIERWENEVRSHWLASGKTQKEMDSWAEDLPNFSWASEADSDDSDLSNWSDSDKDCGEASFFDDYSEPDEGVWQEPVDTSRFDSLSRPEGTDAPDCSPYSGSDVDDGPNQTESPSQARCPQAMVGQDESEQEDIVLYPRGGDIQQGPVNEELGIYGNPATPLAVYPAAATGALPDTLADVRPVYAPTPVYEAGATPRANASQALVRVRTNAGGHVDIRILRAYDSEAYDSPSEPVRLKANNTTTPQTVFVQLMITVPSADPKQHLFRGAYGVGRLLLTYQLVLEHDSVDQRLLRATVDVSGAHVPGPMPTPIRGAPPPQGDPAPTQPREGEGRKKTRRAGRKITARRRRMREEVVQGAAELVDRLMGETAAAAEAAGMVVKEVAFFLNRTPQEIPGGGRIES
ncbi:hypothetical protein BD413DRAFT_673466 [Trametes elegans]|nr:hypothetical protein BD413DRAFT_673466 [Trametes elegans]